MHPSLLPYHPERDVYRLLQVDSAASNDEIAAACRRLSRTFHPDRNRSPRAHEEMGVVNAVRQMLTDPRERATYDRARSRFLSGWTPGAASARRAAVAPIRPQPSRRHRPGAGQDADPETGPGVGQSAGPSAGPDTHPGSRGRRLPELVEQTLRALVDAFRSAVGVLLATRCPSCSAMVEAEYLYCAGCGTRLRRVPRLDFS